GVGRLEHDGRSPGSRPSSLPPSRDESQWHVEGPDRLRWRVRAGMVLLSEHVTGFPLRSAGVLSDASRSPSCASDAQRARDSYRGRTPSAIFLDGHQLEPRVAVAVRADVVVVDRRNSGRGVLAIEAI